jgi:hypothetical protein
MSQSKHYFPLFYATINLLFISCSKNHEVLKEFESFPIEKELVGQELDWKSCNYPAHLMIYDSILTVADAANENLLYFFDLNSDTFLGSVGKKGKGPDEMVSEPWLLPSYRENEKEIFFKFVNQETRTRCEVELFNSIKSKKIIYSNEKKLSSMLPDLIADELSDSIVVGSYRGHNFEEGVFLFDENNEEILNNQKRLKLDYSLDNETYDYVTQEWLKVSRNKQRIVGTFLHLKKIHLYDNQGNINLVIKDKNSEHLDVSNKGPDIILNNPVYYCCSHLSNKYIYIVNRNELLTDKLSKPHSEVLVFSYNGDPIVKYELDRVVTSRSAIYFKNNRLYAWDEFSFAFVYFDLLPESHIK